MKISRVKLANFIADQTLHGNFGRRQAKSVAAYLLEEGQTGDLDSLLRDIEQVWAMHGIVTVTATAAHPLSSTAKAEIEERVKLVYPNARRIIIEQQVDPSVIGGIRLSFTDKQADLTVMNELQQLKILAQRGKE